MDGLAIAAGHEDRHAPLKSYCRGLLLPGERKSIEPMAARLELGSVQAMRQSLHHLVAKAPSFGLLPHWLDCVAALARNSDLPARSPSRGLYGRR
jgi:SRSO17 transposase